MKSLSMGVAGAPKRVQMPANLKNVGLNIKKQEK